MAEAPIPSAEFVSPEFDRRGARLRTSAWVLYDLANTVYAATLTFLFTPWAVEALGGRTALGFTQLASMVLAGLLVPLLGALCDHTARTRGYLTLATLACIGAMAAWSFDLGGAWIIGCFFTANLAYNVSLLFYNSLLPAVATEQRTGFVSGIGVGLGYFGTIVVLAVIMPLPIERRWTFAIAAALFLVTALPCLLWVRDPRPARPGSARDAMRAAFRTTRTTLRELPRQRALLWFLLGNFCLVDVLNTAVFFFADFTTKVFEPAAQAGSLSLFGLQLEGRPGLDKLLLIMGLALNVLALVFGIALGWLTDRAPLRVMRASAVALFGALVGGAWFGGTSTVGYLLTLVTLGSFGLAGIWTAGRKVVLVLAPRDRTGEFFGLYGITTKLSVLGGAIYGLVADHHGVKAGMLAQSLQLAIGLGCLAMVRLPKSGDAAAPNV
ncbi:MAG: MFS transporter [Planctomycetota bacterium]